MIISHSVEETIAAGRELAATAKIGDVFGLVGDLGAGKTQLAKGLVAALGAAAEVTSPTFTLVHEYEGGRLPVYHFDFYRIESEEAALRLGLDDYLFGDGVCLIEWADRFPGLLPAHTHWIAITMRDNGERVIERRVAQ